MKKIATLLMILAVFFSCEVAYENPIDPEAGNFQGFTVVNSINEIEAMEDGHVDSYFLPVLRCSQVNDAQSYEFQVFNSHNLAFDSPMAENLPIQNENRIDLNDFREMFDPWGYEWRVRAHDGNGPGPWAESAEYLYLKSIMGDEVSPQNGGVHAPGNVVYFEFPSIPGVSLYDFREAVTQEGLNTAQAHRVGRTPPMSGFNLLDGETRYWQVRPVHDDGREGFWSEAFTVIGQLEQQSTFYIGLDATYPLDGATVYEENPRLTWSYDGNSQYSGQIDGYQIRYRARSNDFTNSIIHTSGANHYDILLDDPSHDIKPGDALFWQVRAVLMDQSVSDWSSAFQFHTPEALTFDNPTPANLAQVQDSTPTLSWNPATTYEYYEVRYSTESVDDLAITTNLIATGGQTSYTIPAQSQSLTAVNYGDTVFWQVRGLNSNDGSRSGWSAVNQFNVSWNIDWNNLGIYPPSDPNPTPEVFQEVRWPAISGAASYSVKIDAIGNTWTFDTASGDIVDHGTHLTAVVHGASNEIFFLEPYTWTVTAYDSDGVAAPTQGVYQFQRRAPVVGDRINGGVVCHVESGVTPRVLIAALIDSSASSSWLTTPEIFNDLNSDLYFGGQNTQKLLGYSNAALSATLYRGGDYSDWFLPTINEARTLIESFSSDILIQEYNMIENGYYWSSNSVQDQTNAQMYYFSSMEPGTFKSGTSSMSSSRRVRPFRIQEF